MTLVYERMPKNLFDKSGRYDFMTFTIPKQLIRFLKYMNKDFTIIRIY